MERKNPRQGQSRQKYKLPCPHRHAGVDHPEGVELELWPDQIDRIENVMAERKKTAAKGKPESAKPTDDGMTVDAELKVRGDK